MGTWGNQLFEDDEAADIQLDFETKVEAGKSAVEAADEILAEQLEYLDDTDSGPVIYLAVAYLLNDAGVKQHPAIAKALAIIDAGEGLDRWEEVGEPELTERRQEYERVRQKLTSS